MNRTRMPAIGLMLGLILLTGVRTGAQEAKANGITCDFENGLPKDWALSSAQGGPKPLYAPTAELETNGSNTVLELGKNALMTMGDQQYLNFTIEATVRREEDSSGSHVGFQFRNGYRIYLRRPGRVELSGPNQPSTCGFTRSRKTHTPINFKIVVAGPIVRCFVDGKFDGQFSGIALTPGPIALYHGPIGEPHNVYFDNVKLDPEVAPAQFITCEPVTGEDKALVFDPAQDVKLKFTAHNYAESAQEVKLDLEVATFDDKPVCTKSFPAENMKAGAERALEVNLGKVPEGFYRMTIKPTGDVFPLAVHVRGTVTHDRIAMPKILTGVYWYHLNWQLPPVWNYTYLHAACNDLRKHHFNTIICGNGQPEDNIEIIGQYGIRCFTRGKGDKDNVAHPNVIGGFIADEPHKGQEEYFLKEYSSLLTNYPDKIWTTCMIGDGGVEGCQPWWDAWMALSPSNKVVRMLRWYGIKKFNSGIGRTYGSLEPFIETVRGLSRGKGPYYIIMQVFGSNEFDAYFANPLPSQVRGMMHLAAAFQAKGLFFFTYQQPQIEWVAMVETDTLLPTDSKWVAAGEAAGQIQKNADLLAECTWNTRYSSVDGPETLEAFVLARKDDPAQYFYVINRDEMKPVNGRLYNLATTGSLRDLFADKDVPIVEAEVQAPLCPDLKQVSGTAEVSLQPGDGVLLKYMVATETGAALPRVVYPDAVAKAPADKIILLAEVEPLEMPTTGWIPEVKFKGKKWYPDYNSNDLKLYSGAKDAGQLYKKSLWAHAETTIKYAIPEGAGTFAAAAGFGAQNPKSSAIFRVLVDGKEKYNSGVMKIDTPVKPVAVDIAGGKLLELVTEEAGDGLYGDYTFWGEARLIKK